MRLVATLVAATGTELSPALVESVVAAVKQAGARDVSWNNSRQGHGRTPLPLAGGAGGGLVNTGDLLTSPPSIPPVRLRQEASARPDPDRVEAQRRRASGGEVCAADIFFDAEDFPTAARQLISQHPIDLIIQPVATRRKKLLIADMESTIIEQEMLDELADLIGLRDQVADITARAMNGELDFAAALRERVALLKGLPASVIDQVAKRITYMSGAVELLAGMKANGASAWLVSGGFTCFAKPVAERLGFDRVYANELLIRDGVITGEVTNPILDKESKKNFLLQATKELGLTLDQTAAVGDGANDIPMLSTCYANGGLGVAYHAKQSVRAVIPHQINHGDLRVLLWAQG